jgi:hypothetical protein
MQTLFALDPVFAELAFRGWFPWWLAVPLGVLGAAAVGVLYVVEAGRIGFFPRTIMAAIRMAIVALVTFLLLRPVWTSELNDERRRPVAVLVDVSQSMNTNDPRPNPEDLCRVAIAFKLVEADVGVTGSLQQRVVDSLPGEPKGRPRRIEVARAALTNDDPKMDLLRRIGATVGPVEIATFGSRRDGRSAADLKWLEDLKATDPHTALADQVAELLARDPDDLPAAIVLVTDGRENASQKTTLDALGRRAAELGVPIHVYAVGSSAFGLLRVSGIDVPEWLYVDDTVTVPVHYRLTGVPKGKVVIVLKYGDREVVRKEVRLEPRRKVVVENGVQKEVMEYPSPDQTEYLTFTPAKEDVDVRKAQLTATVTVVPDSGGAAETLSDEVSRGVKVTDKKLKVLVVDSTPRYDFKYLQRALLRDRRVEARFYLTDGDFDSMTSGPPWLADLAQVSPTEGELSLSEEEFRRLIFSYDLLILGDVPAKYLSRRHQDAVKAFVIEGGGFIHFAGKWHAPAGWHGAPIADVLPVEYEPRKFPIEELRQPDPFYPVVPDAVGRNPLVTLDDDPLDNAELWGKMDQIADAADLSRRGKRLPPLYWYYPVSRLKPAAEAYLIHPRAKTPAPDVRPMPLLAGHYFGKGFVLFVGFDETWRWRFNEADKYFGRFWSQSVYAAGAPRIFGTKLTQLSIDTTDPVQGKSEKVYVQVLTPDFRPLDPRDKGKLNARLERLDVDPSDKTRFSPVEFNSVTVNGDPVPGQFVAKLPVERAGRFKLHVDPGNENPADLEYRVSLPPDHELSPGPMDEERMRALARDSGGRFYREENLTELPRAIRPQGVPLVNRTETVLWNWLAMVALLGLLTLEWIVRKLNSLS